MGRSSLSLIQLTNSSPGSNNAQMMASQQINMSTNRGPRPLDQVTCFKVRRPFIRQLHKLNSCSRGADADVDQMSLNGACSRLNGCSCPGHPPPVSHSCACGDQRY